MYRGMNTFGSPLLTSLAVLVLRYTPLVGVSFAALQVDTSLRRGGHYSPGSLVAYARKEGIYLGIQ